MSLGERNDVLIAVYKGGELLDLYGIIAPTRNKSFNHARIYPRVFPYDLPALGAELIALIPIACAGKIVVF